MENFWTKKIIIKEGIPFWRIYDKFDKKYLEEITCPICYNLIWNFVDCKKCGNLFCKNCIENSIKQISNSCPICRNTPFDSTNSPGFKKLFKCIYLQCIFKRCKEKIDYFNFKNHLEKCGYRPYYCSNENCQYKNILKNIKDMEIHSKECKQRIINCQNCNEKMKANFLQEHLKECKETVICPKCFEQMSKKHYLLEHKDKTECLEAQIKYYKNKCEKLENNQRNQIESEKKEENQDEWGSGSNSGWGQDLNSGWGQDLNSGWGAGSNSGWGSNSNQKWGSGSDSELDNEWYEAVQFFG